jgi:AcrR family transcriptional regulator
MPKGFSDKEKDIIREQLVEKGQELFATYGLRKTNVEDLTRAVGISKGAFYIFFESKEELFMQIIERFEAEFRKMIITCLAQGDAGPRENFKQVLRSAFSAWRNNPITRRFSQEDYQHLLRKLSPERVKNHLRGDDEFVLEMVEYLKGQGVKIEASSEVVSGLMKALFFVSFHAEEIGPAVYPQTMDLLIDLVGDHLIEG